jgi:hypothetical protein
MLYEKTYIPMKLDSRTEERVKAIVDLSRRRALFLEAQELYLEALAILAADYEAANMPSAAADLLKRLRWYGTKVVKRGEEVGSE